MVFKQAEKISNRLPKLYAPANVRFGSLRGALGAGGGVMEIDVTVIRKARRVIDRYGKWAWQLVISPAQLKSENGWGPNAEDQICINNEREDVVVLL